MGSGEGFTMRNFIVSPYVVWVIKSRILRWAGHVIAMEEVRSAFKIWEVNLLERCLQKA